MHSLHRSSICIDSIGTIRVLLFGKIVLMSKPRMRVIVDAAAQKMLSLRPPSTTSSGVPAISVEVVARQSAELFLPGWAGRLK